MSSVLHDFTGYQVLVVGGTRGTGLTIANQFADAGADVTVTGTMMLRELYDTRLARFNFETVNLARQSSIDSLAATVGDLDVLVLSAGANLPYGLPDEEGAFITQAVRSGVLGPTFLTTRLRLKLSQSPAPGGGCVIHAGSVRQWFEMAHPGNAVSAKIQHTERLAEQYAGIGVRVNTVVTSPRGLLPRQQSLGMASGRGRSEGNTLVRASTAQGLAAAVADSALFLASDAAARVTGQVIRVS